MATIGKYVFTVDSDDTIFVHLYISCSAEIQLSGGRTVAVVMESNGPWEGGATIRVVGSVSNGVRFSLRRPLGATDFKVRRAAATPIVLSHYFRQVYANGAPVAELAEGRVEVTLVDESLDVKFSYAPRILDPHPLTLDNLGCIAFARGPFVYCAETVDNPAVEDLRALRIMRDQPVKELVDERSFEEWGIRPVVLEVDATVVQTGARTGGQVVVRLVPVFLWANRQRSDLRVWLAAQSCSST